MENTGENTIQNWYLGFDYNNSITNIWNAEIFLNEDIKYVIKNVGWNQDIAAGNSVEFGISGDHAFRGFPENYELIGTDTEVTENDYAIQYIVDGDWGTGFYGSISVTNNTDITLEDWVLEFDFDREITEIWNGVIEEHEGNHYVVRNAKYNSAIAPGENVSIGIKGCEGEVGNEPCRYALYSYRISDENIEIFINTNNLRKDEKFDYYYVTDKTCGINGTISSSSKIKSMSYEIKDCNNNMVESGSILVSDSWDAINMKFTLGANFITVKAISKLGKEIEKKTNPFIDDTDGDGLLDGEEVYKYCTKPDDKDTDKDGVTDGKELEISTNPLVAEKMFDITVIAQEEDSVKVSVSTSLSGNQVESLSVHRFENDCLFPTTMPGYIGGAYDFSVEGTFSSATLRFEFNECLLGDETFEPTIYYYNEEKQRLEALPTTVTDNVATTTVNHFSKYILLNRTVYEESFEWQDVWSTTGYSDVEVILVIDDSDSMYYNDPLNQRLKVSKNLVDNLPENSRVGIVRFTNTTKLLTEMLTEDKEAAKTYLSSSYFKSSGGTNMYNAINSSFSLFESMDDTTLRMMVVLSDGVTSDTRMHSSVVATANEKGVKLYTVG